MTRPREQLRGCTMTLFVRTTSYGSLIFGIAEQCDSCPRDALTMGVHAICPPSCGGRVGDRVRRMDDGMELRAGSRRRSVRSIEPEHPPVCVSNCLAAVRFCRVGAQALRGRQAGISLHCPLCSATLDEINRQLCTSRGGPPLRLCVFACSRLRPFLTSPALQITHKLQAPSA